MLATGRHASDSVFTTGPRTDQLEDKRCWLSVTCRVTRAGDEDTSIINVTYRCISPMASSIHCLGPETRGKKGSRFRKGWSQDPRVRVDPTRGVCSYGTPYNRWRCWKDSCRVRTD